MADEAEDGEQDPGGQVVDAPGGDALQQGAEAQRDGGDDDLDDGGARQAPAQVGDLLELGLAQPLLLAHQFVVHALNLGGL